MAKTTYLVIINDDFDNIDESSFIEGRDELDKHLMSEFELSGFDLHDAVEIYEIKKRGPIKIETKISF